MSLLAQPVPNYEEAATVAADFISSMFLTFLMARYFWRIDFN